jgi:hypothetical protein
MFLEGDAQSVLRLQVARRLSVDLHLARGRLVKAGQQSQDRALPTSGGTDQGDKFTIKYLQVQRAERRKGLLPTATAPAQIRSGDAG